MFSSRDIGDHDGLVLLKNESWAYERSRRLLAAGIAVSVTKLPSNIFIEEDGSVYLARVSSPRAYCDKV